MADNKPGGAKPAQTTTGTFETINSGQTFTMTYDPLQARRDEFAKHFGAAILTRGNRTPHALAKEVTDYVDAFLAALDK